MWINEDKPSSWRPAIFGPWNAEPACDQDCIVGHICFAIAGVLVVALVMGWI